MRTFGAATRYVWEHTRHGEALGGKALGSDLQCHPRRARQTSTREKPIRK